MRRLLNGVKVFLHGSVSSFICAGAAGVVVAFTPAAAMIQFAVFGVSSFASSL